MIVIEGADGSGKATQSRLLLRRLRREGVRAERIAFPQYGKSFFGELAAAYLRGEFGPSDRVDPRLAALLYAGDRWEAAEWLLGRLRAGVTVVCDRYVDSNKAHQGARLPRGADLGAFLDWLDRLEYRVLRLPRADFTIFLHVPPATAERLISRKGRRAYLRGRRRDIHEADRTHLRRAEAIYLRLARQRPAGRGCMIRCVERGKLLSKSAVRDQVWSAVRKEVEN